MATNNKNLTTVKPGDKIAFIDGPGFSPEYPSYEGVAYGFYRSERWGDQLRVKVTDDCGNVSWRYVVSFTKVGIGAYHIPVITPVTVTEVVLNRAEGPTDLCGIDHKFPRLSLADNLLMVWAWGMPADQMGYDKVDFTVYLSNGDTYEGRFDLKPSHRISASIKNQMVGHLEWCAKNGDMIGAKYAEQAKVALPVYRAL